jgi:hypothetical protein
MLQCNINANGAVAFNGLIKDGLMTTFNGVIDAAAGNVGAGNDIAIACGQIVARRVALGMAAAMNPLQADHAEFERMVPEKMEAFSAAGMVMLEQSNQAGWELTRLASDEVMTTARATVAMATCVTPAGIAEAQSQFALAWLERATTNFFAIGILALSLQRAVMAPIEETVAANSERLSL